MVARAKTPKCGSLQGSDTLIPDAKSVDDPGSGSGSDFSGDSSIEALNIPLASKPATKARRIAKKSLGTQETCFKKPEADYYEIPRSSPHTLPAKSQKPKRKPPAAAKILPPPAEPNRVSKAKLFKRVFRRKPELSDLVIDSEAQQMVEVQVSSQDFSSSQSAANENVEDIPARIADKTSQESLPQLYRRSLIPLNEVSQLSDPSEILAAKDSNGVLAAQSPIQIAFSEFSSHDHVVSQRTKRLPVKKNNIPAGQSESCHTVDRQIVSVSSSEPEDRVSSPVGLDSECAVRDRLETGPLHSNTTTLLLKRSHTPPGSDRQKRTKFNPRCESLSASEAQEVGKRIAATRKVNHKSTSLKSRCQRLRDPQDSPPGLTPDIAGTALREPGRGLLQIFAEDEQGPSQQILGKQAIVYSDASSKTAPHLLKRSRNGFPGTGRQFSGEMTADKQTNFENEWWDTIRVILQNSLDDIKCKEDLFELIVCDLMSIKSKVLAVKQMHKEDRARLLVVCSENCQKILRQCDRGRDSLRRTTDFARVTSIEKILAKSQNQTKAVVGALQDLSYARS